MGLIKILLKAILIPIVLLVVVTVVVIVLIKMRREKKEEQRQIQNHSFQPPLLLNGHMTITLRSHCR
ncbi:hypothetical protein N7526_009660 [Penicillium atrosanguineum]|nr:hypothetical protein N7526_009660 [Penicillium atrosanguineum]